MFSLLKYFRWFIVGGLALSSLVCSVHAGIASTINLDLQAIPPAPGTLLLPPAAKKAPTTLVAGMGGSGGSGASGVGATSKPAGQAGIVTRKNGIATHQLSFVTLDDKGDEREGENDPPPTEKAQPESAVPISCQRCQNTLNEQESSRILRESTAEPVLCDTCLYSVAQALQSTGKRKTTRKAARKRARPVQAEVGHMQPPPKTPRLSDKGPEEGRPLRDYTIQTQAAGEEPSENRTGKRKQASHPQSEPSAKRVRLKTTTESAEALEILKQSLSFEMNEQENRAARQLFETLKRTNIRIKQTLYKLLSRVDRKELPTFCAKASVFFDSLTATIKDTGCLTSMLGNKKHLQDFAKRKDSELKYLAGLDTLRTLSSMNNGKGLPDEVKVKAILDWAVWKVDGQFSRELFRAVSSMNNGKGLPHEAKVKAMLDWPVWKVDGQFSRELFRTVSSMNSGKGLPDETKVKAMLDWAVWKVDGQFSMGLFRAVSSMNSGKGLPDETKVKAMLDWAVWKVDGQFSRELFRAVSSMNNGKGLPDESKVKAMLDWAVWKVDGQFSRELFRAVSSMTHCKGLPDEAKVKAMLDWPVWKVDGQFNMELFRAVLSMNSSRGLPDEAKVKAMMEWPVWKMDGQFSRELFRALSSMNNGKGLPDEGKVKAMLDWPVWKVDGQFSRELFRAVSSMNNGKGLPDEAKVKAMLDWAVWKVDGQFSRELFRAVSSMTHGKGLPDEAKVKAMLDWPVWKVDGQFSMELFRALSSMNNGKGLPDEAKVKAILDWPVWKVDGQFSRELFRAVSSMNSSRGLPDEAKVKAMLDWPVWNVDGQFSMELFRAVSSMNSSRGLPDEAKVKAMLDWAVWKVDGQFSMELFRALSSMNNGKGLPDEGKVKAMLDWPVWKVDGQFSMELFRALSSINNGKGLPDEAKVKAMLDWPVWKMDGQFSMELFRALSSMNNGKGLPDEGKVKAMLDWPVWKVDGQFSMELFRALSSMNNGKGLPDEAKVKAMLDWAVWKVDGQFSMELFRAVSSMTHGKGLPDEGKVKAMLDWAVWKVDGQFSRELFRAVSSMNSSRGLPDEAKVKAMLDWLNCGKFNDVLQSLMVRLYTSEGMPDTKTLKQYEQKLSELFFPNAINELESDDCDDKEEQSCLIKQVALFLSTRKPQYFLNFETIEHFYQHVTGDGNDRLEKLLQLLTSYGGAGVIRYLALGGDDRKVLLSTCSSRISLPLAMKVINGFSPQERQQYLFFNRNLKAPPDKAQWNNIHLQLESLASLLKTPYAQRFYLEVVWGLGSSDRETFLDKTRVAAVLKVFPSLNALKNLANKHSRQWLKELFEACLQYGQGAPSRENIKRLFTALLEAQLPLAGHGNIPDHFLSGHMALGDSAILIPVIPPVQTPEELALYFMAAVMGGLSDMFYDYEANTLKIEQYGGERHTFPAPELKIHDDGLEISNWTDEVFNHFLAVTEFPEHYYFSEEAWQQHCTPEVPGYLQRRTAAFRQRERAAPDAHTFQPLSIPTLIGLLKSNIHINAAAWKSFDHQKDRLPRAAQSRLLSEMEKAPHGDIPVSLRDYLEAGRLEKEAALPQNEMSAAVVGPSAMEVELSSKEKRFQSLWADLSRKERVIVADLELLAGYKE